jgi:nucleotide-binding universal stress UspA family protein
MASTNADAGMVGAPTGPVLFAYDGSELAQFAIEQAGHQLAHRRDALIVCVWQPGDVGFVPVGGQRFDAAAAGEVRKAAEETAASGASIAQKAGFQAHSMAVEAAPTWKGIAQAAEEHGSSLIVLGPHRRSGIKGHLLGSVTAAVAAHSACSLLIIHQPS